MLAEPKGMCGGALSRYDHYSTATPRYRNAKGFKGIDDEPCKAAFKIGNCMHTMAQESRAKQSTAHIIIASNVCI